MTIVLMGCAGDSDDDDKEYRISSPISRSRL